MADQLATPSDLAAYLQSDVDTATATLLVECATAVVQAACGGQRIVRVTGDTLTLLGTTESWLDLPQLPVTAVSSVTLDGTALTASTDYKVFGNRLFRKFGWQTNYGWPWDYQYGWYPGNSYYPPPSLANGFPFQEPSAVVVVCTHGYASGAQELQLARQACLTLAAGVYVNPDGATRAQIDDYAAQFDAMAARMEASQHLKAALRKQYGRRAGLVRIG
jgi:hypothetical protein